ncbi:unnamed protein product [Vicia faba]|uniref:Uncharacterized protein n=1 Tax=Vicia faba TaxID=3906 RepID=A0AAV0ZN37_VICFA|nr:unnamed protein product [Vicia faba]
MEPHVESHVDPYVEPNVETSVPASSETRAKPPTKLVIDIHVFDTHVNDILDEYDDSSEDLRDENPQNKDLGVQGERIVEFDEDDDIFLFPT